MGGVFVRSDLRKKTNKKVCPRVQFCQQTMLAQKHEDKKHEHNVDEINRKTKYV
jgi:hypothetical protein